MTREGEKGHAGSAEEECMNPSSGERSARVGVDTGGTFTDFLVFRDGRVSTHKVLSTPGNPAEAVLAGLRETGLAGTKSVVHGSTVATNALLERKGVRTALIATKGFEDVLEIGRQTRPDIYRLFVVRPAPLVDARFRFGVDERVLCGGEAEKVPELVEIREVLEKIRKAGIESIAICLLHAYANHAHEETVAALAEGLGIPVSVSHRILPEYREFERTSTTVVNAYVSPLMNRYLSLLNREMGEGPLRIMQSNGGSIAAETAKSESVRTILSGPAGGVVGAFETARAAGLTHVITFDMGGTSTDVSLCDGGIRTTAEASVAGFPVRVPMIDIHTVGAGGGSIARVDTGGALRVGPESAGADPGPVCYGKGEEITTTDANLYLGRLLPDHFLGGRMRLAAERVEERIRALASRLSVSPMAAAEGVVRVANAAMERAIRVVSVEKGYDPREFVLVCFGGAGPLHACDLAAALSIPKVLVPENPGLLSALGMLLSDVIKDYSRTHLWRTAAVSPEEIDSFFAPLAEQALADMGKEGIPAGDVRVERFLDMRYHGQSYEITVPYGGEFEREFHREHQRMYGYRDPERETEIVNVRVRSVGTVGKPVFPEREPSGEDPSAAFLEKRILVENGEERGADIYRRSGLAMGNLVTGPAIVVEFSSTVYIPSGWECRVDRRGNLVLKPREVPR
jgi:N-methylhydantoinase A